MTMTEILAHAQTLSDEESEAVIAQLAAMSTPKIKPRPQTGREIVAWLEATPPRQRCFIQKSKIPLRG